MYTHKGSRDSNERSARSRKRKFYGNQYTENNDADPNDSATARKLKTANAEDVPVNHFHVYRILEFFAVFNALSNMLICGTCKTPVTFAESGHRGLGFKIIVTCACGRREIHSGPFIGSGYEINRRIVFVMRLLGVGLEGVNIFCGLMDICKGLSKNAYGSAIQHIHSAASTMFETFSKKAVDEEKAKNVQNGRYETHLKVSGDGSWKKRGFTSLYGVTTIIGYYSGKVLDVVVKSSFCQACSAWSSRTDTIEYEKWYPTHKESCSSNHEGSAGKMEVDSMIEMFGRSEENFGVKYLNYIGDGDSKTYASIVKNNPYGDEHSVIKSECVGHVQKRMGTRLRNIKKKEKLGGKGRLTDPLIKKLTIFYGLAIRNNLNSVEDMKTAIMSTLDHYCSTDEKPRHDNCPHGAKTWCNWRKAQVAGTLESFRHPINRVIQPDIEEYIRPIYEDLSRDDLLTKCLGGHTQNANESFNSTVWRMTPKHLNSGKKIIDIATYIAAGVFNEGYAAVIVMLHLLKVTIGRECKMFADQVDLHRVARADRQHSASSKEARTARREAQQAQNDFFEEAEGVLYGAGIAE